MDLSVYSLPRLVKEKRERQPNWTEHEKQLLVSLTRGHQAILENKGSDTMTLKRKSDAWNDIVMHMNAAGYNRSKERLKQQLGRIRAAEAKRYKEALEKSSNNFNLSNNNDVMDVAHVLQERKKVDKVEKIMTSPREVANEVPIKEENTVSADNESNEEELNCPSPPIGHNYDDRTESEIVQHSVMRLVLQNIQALGGKSFEKENAKDNLQNLNTKSDLVTPLSDIDGKNALNIETQTINIKANHIPSGPEEHAENETTTQSSVLQKRRTSRSTLVNIFRTPKKKEHCIRQLHMYRVAVERERLRSLKIQQKRDRILHRKDVEIQNLKLQILRNISNQTRDAKRSYF